MRNHASLLKASALDPLCLGSEADGLLTGSIWVSKSFCMIICKAHCYDNLHAWSAHAVPEPHVHVVVSHHRGSQCSPQNIILLIIETPERYT